MTSTLLPLLQVNYLDDGRMVHLGWVPRCQCLSALRSVVYEEPFEVRPGAFLPSLFVVNPLSELASLRRSVLGTSSNASIRPGKSSRSHVSTWS
jgi:hypothetical protein